MVFRPRGSALPGSGDSSDHHRSSPKREMDLGTQSLLLGVFSILTAWIPLLNIVVFIAALMAIGFGALARWPTGWIANAEPDPQRALWGMVLGGLALAEFAVAVFLYLD